MFKNILGVHMSTHKQKYENSTLTKKQDNFFNFLKGYFQERGYPPTVREIVDGMGFSSTHIARKYLEILERKGYVKRQFNSPRAIEIVDVSARSSEARSIPIVGVVRAGVPHPAIEDIEGYFPVDKSVCRNNNAFFLRVAGDSMIEAHILEGDLVLVVPQPVANNGEIVVALINDEATVKRLYKRGDTIQLKPEHPTMKPIVVKEGDAKVSIVGRVVAVIRQLDKQPAMVVKR